MRKKTELKEQINRFYHLKRQARKGMKANGYPLSRLSEPFQIVDYCILSLKWVLGYKVKYTGEHYWCFRCHLMHPDTTCPKCGNDKIMEENND